MPPKRLKQAVFASIFYSVTLFALDSSSGEPSEKAAQAHLFTGHARSGSTFLQIEFKDIPLNFSVDSITLKFSRYIGPQSITKITSFEGSTFNFQPAYFDATILAATEKVNSTSTPGEKSFPDQRLLGFRHDPKEPSAIVIICLWLEGDPSREKLRVEPLITANKDVVLEPKDVIVLLDSDNARDTKTSCEDYYSE